MKVKFLGTSAGWPLPRLGCKCEICSSKDPKDTRTRTQLLINEEILLDAGPDTYQHLSREKIEKLEAILISHEHPDHIMGLWDLSHLYGEGKKIPLYVTQPVLNGIRKIFPPVYMGPIKPVIVKENRPFAIGNAEITYFPVIHGNVPAFGIKIKKDKIFAYITDFNRILPSQHKTVKYADHWAIDGSSLGKLGQGPGHISIQDGIEISQKLKVKNTYFVHIGHKTGTHEYLEGYLKEKAGPNFHIAFDGLEIDI